MTLSVKVGGTEKDAKTGAGLTKATSAIALNTKKQEIKEEQGTDFERN
jgi:hypothetical protein